MFNIFKYLYMDQAGDDGAAGGGGASTILNSGDDADDDIKDKGGDAGADGDTGSDDGAGDSGGDADDGASGGSGDDNKAAWTDNWRERIAETIAGEKEGDAFDKELKRLQRFQSPDQVYNSFREIEKKISSGEYRRPLPKDADEKTIEKYRKDNNIPTDWNGYYDSMKDINLSEESKPILDDLLETVVHPNNLPPEVAKEMAQWMVDIDKARQETMAEEDKKAAQETEDTLREEFGKEYRPNINMVNNMLNRMPEAMREDFQNARFPDGRAIFNSPEVIKFLSAIERDINPAASIIEGNHAPGLTDVRARIEEIKKLMPTKAYKQDEKLQQEYRDLLSAEAKLSSRQ